MTVPVAVGPVTSIPRPAPGLSNPFTTNPRIVQPGAVMVRPLAPAPADIPRSLMTGVPAKSGADQPSMVTASVIVGRADSGWIVWGPAPGMLNVTTSAPAAELAWVMASRSVPALPSSRFDVTRNWAG